MKTTITKNQNGFDRLYWIANQKKDKQDLRCHIKNVMVKKDKLVSTNGAWLCEVDLSKTGIEIAEGFYSFGKVNKSVIELIEELTIEEGNFPDYDFIFDTEGHNLLEGRLNSHSLDYGISYAIRAMEENSFNLDYFKSLIEHDIEFEEYIDPEGLKPLVLLNGNCKAALMPVML